MKGRKSLAGVLVFAVFMLGAFLLSETFAAENIAYVDAALVIQGYSKKKDYDSKIEDTLKAKQAELDKKSEDIKTMQDKLPLLSEKEKTNKQNEIENKVRDFQEFQRIAEADLRKERIAQLKEIEQELLLVINAVAKEKGYSLVLNKEVVLYSSTTGSDISNEILKRLNDNYKKK